MQDVTQRERYVRGFHDARPGVTSHALGRAGSYDRIAARVPTGRALDLGCGDGTLLGRLGRQSIGIDISRGELNLARRSGVVVQARAQALPFRDQTFDAATAHLTFMLFDEIELVVAELHRVLKPGAPFIALLGGGPTADGHDAFHRFADLCTMTKVAGPQLDIMRGISDRRASSEAGWRDLFRDWSAPVFERWPLDLGGTFDEVWTFLEASYSLRDSDKDRVRDQLRQAFPGDYVPCTVVTFCATVTRS